LIYFGVKFAATGTRQTSSYLMLPMSCYYAGIPVSGALMAFFMLEQLIEQTGALFDKGENRSC
jgi:TRAP-type C4-dicarboxylate transport system permease small subunit